MNSDKKNLENYFKDKKITIKQIKKYCNLFYCDLQYFKNDFYSYSDLYDFEHYLKYLLLGLLHKKCLTCGKYLSQRQIDTNKKYCCYACSMNYQQIKKRNMQKYGVQFLTQSKKIKDKIKKNVKQKYGVENVSQLKSTKQKVKKTNLEKYGKQFALQNLQIKQKVKHTNLKKYGEQWITKSHYFKEKSKKTNLEKYGVEYSSQSTQVKQKIKKTNLNNYGCQNVFQNQQIKNKIKETNLEKYNSEHYQQSKQFRRNIFQQIIEKYKDYVIPMFTLDQFEGITSNKLYKWKCVKCGNQFENYHHLSNVDGNQTYIPRCLKCYPYLNNGNSYYQKQLSEFIYSVYNGKIICNDRIQIHPQQLDIYIPQKQLAIQFDGIYWHSDQKLHDKNYHLKKTQICQKKGIKLIHIFENQWKYKKDIVKDIIKRNLNIYQNIIDCNYCLIRRITNSIAKQFLQQNYIFGKQNTNINFGLFYNNLLVEIISAIKLNQNNYKLICITPKLNYQIINGENKLLEYFKDKFNPVSIITYIDRRYFDNNLYNTLNFTFLGTLQPSCYYFDKQYRKSYKINYNLLIKQIHKNVIYDCGDTIFIKIFH